MPEWAIELLPFVVVLGTITFLCWHSLHIQTCLQTTREELVVVKIKIKHKDEEIERWKERVEHEKKMRAHTDAFLAEIGEKIFALPDEEDEEAPC